MPYPAQGGHPIMHNMIMWRRMEDWYFGNQLQPQFPMEVGGNPSSTVEFELWAQVFPGSVTHLSGMPTVMHAQVLPSNVAHLAGKPSGQVQDNIITKDGVEEGTINTHFVMDRQKTWIL
jgi:hypothetical protein